MTDTADSGLKEFVDSAKDFTTFVGAAKDELVTSMTFSALLKPSLERFKP
jgi:hypothetical protein